MILQAKFPKSKEELLQCLYGNISRYSSLKDSSIDSNDEKYVVEMKDEGIQIEEQLKHDSEENDSSYKNDKE